MESNAVIIPNIGVRMGKLKQEKNGPLEKVLIILKNIAAYVESHLVSEIFASIFSDMHKVLVFYRGLYLSTLDPGLPDGVHSNQPCPSVSPSVSPLVWFWIYPGDSSMFFSLIFALS